MRFRLPFVTALLGLASPLWAWNEPAHRIITELAVQALPADFPAWVRLPENVRRLSYLSGEPDRWRGEGTPQLNHINSPDHYLDIERLAGYGLTLQTLPRFRGEFIETLAVYRERHPSAVFYDPRKDKDHTRATPGLLPYAIEELREKTAASWSVLLAFEQYPEVATADELGAARANVLHYMGLLSHFAGDSTQPLHVSKHHNGWTGDNPHGYTTNPQFHAYIDGGVVTRHGLTFASLAGRARPPGEFDPVDPWAQILAALAQTLAKVEPLYQLEKSGDLDREPGKIFIEQCLLEGGARLAGLWVSAWKDTRLDPYLIKSLEARRAKRFVPEGMDKQLGQGKPAGL